MRIVALDFETANSHLESACSLGISIYEEGEILDSYEWYFKPHQRYCYFTNSHIHGIVLEDVIHENEFVFYYEELCTVLKNSVLVAHNARFDLGVLNSLCDLYGLDHLNNKYLDTVEISRKVYPELYNHKLNTVCDYLNIDLSHHNGQSDSMGCLMILLKAMQAYNTFDLDEFLNKINVHYKENM